MMSVMCDPTTCSMLVQSGKHLGEAALDVAAHRAGGTGKHTTHGAKIGDRVVGGYFRRARGVTGRRFRVAADRLENRRVDEGGGEAMRPPALLGVRDAIPGPSVGLINVAEKPEGEAAHAVGRDHRVDTVCLVANLDGLSADVLQKAGETPGGQR